MIAIRKVLCPVDFSPCSDHALEYAVEFAQAYKADLELLHVVQVTTAVDAGADMLGPRLYDQVVMEMEKIGTARLNELVEKIRQKHAKVSQFIVTGVAFVEIVRRAREQGVDMIVMGTHGRSGLSHAIIGSCAEKVVRKAPCPVLTVRHPEHDFVMP